MLSTADPPLQRGTAWRHSNLAHRAQAVRGRGPREGAPSRLALRGSGQSARRGRTMTCALLSPRCWRCGRTSSGMKAWLGVKGFWPSCAVPCAPSVAAASQGIGPTTLPGTSSCCGFTGRSWLRSRDCRTPTRRRSARSIASHKARGSSCKQQYRPRLISRGACRAPSAWRAASGRPHSWVQPSGNRAATPTSRGIPRARGCSECANAASKT